MIEGAWDFGIYTVSVVKDLFRFKSGIFNNTIFYTEYQIYIFATNNFATPTIYRSIVLLLLLYFVATPYY